MSAPARASDSRAAIKALLCRFRLIEVLDEDPTHKTAWLLGRIAGEEEDAGEGESAGSGAVPGVDAAVVTVERLPFSVSVGAQAAAGLFADVSLDSGEQNDVYSWAAGAANSTAFGPDLRVSVIYPATAKHISKHRRQQRRWIRETPALYEQVVRPAIDAQPASRIQWVHNILSKRVEAERILFEDPDPEHGFIILPDLKWDTANPATMYLTAIVHRKDTRSLRDLDGTHLRMLKNIRAKSAVAAQRFGVPSDMLRLYIHYQPSYYHFHVHITNVSFVGPGMAAGRAHLLDTVISNIEDIAPDYYQRATLAYALGSDDELWQHWAAHPSSTG
ncbi:hypothetical protein H4R18_002888 [Coemansia javaensis]|uniref:m7GpppX diphosphatase n=1 Tax=Coemansia javaensis TaxID=2761396 RepID=A0A9W8HGB0_9FUNG|nr:hypothetical protein H4R18_002888 [Coemansia javaensis]